ncbi:MAG: DMT family transporter [Actinomycetes bacterium]
MSRRGWLLFLALGLIWGTPYLMIRVAVVEIDPGSLMFFRTAIASLLFLPLVISRGQWKIVAKAWPWVAIYAVCEMGIPWLLMGQAERRLSSSLTGLIVAAVPLIGAVATRLSHPEDRLSPKRILGLLAGSLGVALLVGIDVTGASWLSVGMMFIVALGYSLGPIIISLKLSELPALEVVAASVMMVAIGYAPWGLSHLPNHLSASVSWSILGLALGPTVLGFLAFFYLIREVGPHRSMMVTYLNPLVAVILGVSILGEQLTLGMLLGFPLIVLGAILATSQVKALEAKTS